MRGKAIEISPEYANFIRENSGLTLIPELAKLANQQGFEQHNLGTVQRFIRRNNLPIYKVRHTYTKKQVNFIKDNQHLTRKDLLIQLNKKFKLAITRTALNTFCSSHKFKCLNTEHRFQKGSKPWCTGMKGLQFAGNKSTQFKKGHPALNFRPLGYERVDSKTGFIEVRVATRRSEKGNLFRRKHIVIWEEVHGPIPPAHAVVFLDGDNRNFDIRNLMLLSIGAVAMRNKLLDYKASPAELKPTINLLTKLMHKQKQLEK